MVQSALPVSLILPIRSITSSHSTIPKPLVDKVVFSIQSAKLIDEQFRNDFEGICRYLADYDISISQATSSHVRKDRSSINIELANSAVAFTLQELNRKILKALFHLYWNEQGTKLQELNQRFARMFSKIQLPSERECEDHFIGSVIKEAFSGVEGPVSPEIMKERLSRDQGFQAEVNRSKATAMPNGVEVDRGLVSRIAQYYPSNPKAAWNGFYTELSSVLQARRREDVTELLEKLVNVYYVLLKPTFAEIPGEDNQAYKRRLSEKVGKDLSHAFQYYFVNNDPGSIEKKSLIVQAAGRIDSGKLMIYATGFLPDDFTDPFTRANINGDLKDIYETKVLRTLSGEKTLRLTDASNSQAAVLGITDGRSSRSVAGFLGTSASNAEAADLKKASAEIQVSPRFYELPNIYCVGSVLHDSGSGISPEQIGTATSLYDFLPKPIFESLDLAFNREKEKLKSPIPDEVSLFTDINEQIEYLKHLTVTASKDGTKLNEALKKISGDLHPSVFFITQVFKAYFEKHVTGNHQADEIRKSYITVLNSLSENTVFEQVHKIVSNLSHQDKREKGDAALEQNRTSAANHATSRKLDRAEACKSLREQKPKRSGQTVTYYLPLPGKLSDPEDREVSANGFLRRLTDPSFLNPTNRTILNFEPNEAKLEIIYLISGMIVLSPSFNVRDELMIFDPDKGIILKSKAAVLEEFAGAIKKLNTVFHPDRAHEDFKYQMNGDSTFAREATSLFGEISSLPKDLSGWKEGSFTERFINLATAASAIAESKSGGKVNFTPSAQADLTEVDGLRERVQMLEQVITLMAEVLSETLPASSRKTELEGLVKRLGFPVEPGDTVVSSQQKTVVG